MKYKYINSIVSKWERNEFFDPRENKGCSDDEILQIKKAIAPYFKRLPRAIEECYHYFGKYQFNQPGPILVTRLETIEHYEVDIEQELKEGFYMFSAPYFGVLTDDFSPIKEFTELDVDYIYADYDNPPLWNKGGDLIDNDVELNIMSPTYVASLEHYSNAVYERYVSFYRSNHHIYPIKSALVELYSAIENATLIMPITLAEKYGRLVHSIRNKTGWIIHSWGVDAKSILSFFRPGHLLNNGVDPIDELKQYSKEVEIQYKITRDLLEDYLAEN